MISSVAAAVSGAFDELAVTLSSADTRRQRAADERNESFLRADAPEYESGLGLHNLAVHLKQRIS